VASESGAIIRSVPLSSGCVWSLAYAPSGQQLAAGCEFGSLHLVAPESGAIIHSVPLSSGHVGSLAYAPSGQQLAAGCESGSLHLVAPESAAIIRSVPLSSGCVESLAYAPSGQQLAAGCHNGSLHLVASESGAIIRSVPLSSGCVWSLAYAPSGLQLAAGCEFGSLHLVAPESGAIVHSVPLSSGRVWSLAYAPSGQQLEAGCELGSLHLVAPESGAIVRSVHLSSGRVWSLAYEPNYQQEQPLPNTCFSMVPLNNGVISVACEGAGQAPQGSNVPSSNGFRWQADRQLADSSCAVGAAVDARNIAIMPVVHNEPAVSIEPDEAAAIESAQFAGRTERMIACGFAPQSGNVAVDSEDSIFICTLNRRPKELVRKLQHFLKTCIDALEAEGHRWKLLEGSLIFVHPYQYRSAVRSLSSHSMHPSNIVIAASLEYLLEEALAGIGKGAWAKHRELLSVQADTDLASFGESIGSELERQTCADPQDPFEDEINMVFVEKRTFLSYVQAPLDATSVVQSTTEADSSKGQNPRRARPGNISTA